jgi:endonuclease YncB( thermonuclease family)
LLRRLVAEAGGRVVCAIEDRDRYGRAVSTCKAGLWAGAFEPPWDYRRAKRG